MDLNLMEVLTFLLNSVIVLIHTQAVNGLQNRLGWLSLRLDNQSA